MIFIHKLQNSIDLFGWSIFMLLNWGSTSYVYIYLHVLMMNGNGQVIISNCGGRIHNNVSDSDVTHFSLKYLINVYINLRIMNHSRSTSHLTIGKFDSIKYPTHPQLR